jgi:hypothetical protein
MEQMKASQQIAPEAPEALSRAMMEQQGGRPQ